jgi:TonB family protein
MENSKSSRNRFELKQSQPNQSLNLRENSSPLKNSSLSPISRDGIQFELPGLDFTDDFSTQSESTTRELFYQNEDPYDTFSGTPLDIDLPGYVPPQVPEEDQTFKFVSASSAGHLFLSLAISILGISTALDKKIEDTPVEITVMAKGEDSRAVSRPGPLGSAQVQTALHQSSPKISEKITASDVVVKMKPAMKAVKAAALKQPAKTTPLLEKSSPVAIKVKAKKATLEDIENPDIDFSNAKLNEEIDETEIANELDRETRIVKKNLMTKEIEEMSALEDQADDLIKSADAKIKGIKALGANQDAEMAARQKALFHGMGTSGRGTGSKTNSEGSGSNAGGSAVNGSVSGSNLKSTAASGSPQGVRGIDQLAQMPGNTRPQYDADDRFNKREGLVNFVAYVSQQGKIEKMLLKKSSGHSSLDLKALAAIKTWKFYPGQQGWVEIPFNWTLKGAPELKGPVLRRSARN